MTETNAAEAYKTDPYVINHPHETPFWQAAAEGRMIVPRCKACGRTHWYPRPFCPLCHADELEWIEASGRGTIYSFSVMRRAKPEYAVALVTLEEGPQVTANLIDCDLNALKIGQAVKVRFVPTPQGRMVPAFVPG